LGIVDVFIEGDLGLEESPIPNNWMECVNDSLQRPQNLQIPVLRWPGLPLLMNIIGKTALTKGKSAADD